MLLLMPNVYMACRQRGGRGGGGGGGGAGGGGAGGAGGGRPRAGGAPRAGAGPLPTPPLPGMLVHIEAPMVQLSALLCLVPLALEDTQLQVGAGLGWLHEELSVGS